MVNEPKPILLNIRHKGMRYSGNTCWLLLHVRLFWHRCLAHKASFAAHTHAKRRRGFQTGQTPSNELLCEQPGWLGFLLSFCPKEDFVETKCLTITVQLGSATGGGDCSDTARKKPQEVFRTDANRVHAQERLSPARHTYHSVGGKRRKRHRKKEFEQETMYPFRAVPEAEPR